MSKKIAEILDRLEGHHVGGICDRDAAKENGCGSCQELFDEFDKIKEIEATKDKRVEEISRMLLKLMKRPCCEWASVGKPCECNAEYEDYLKRLEG